jgi:hypothetical protein
MSTVVKLKFFSQFTLKMSTVVKLKFFSQFTFLPFFHWIQYILKIKFFNQSTVHPPLLAIPAFCCVGKQAAIHSKREENCLLAINMATLLD